MRQVPGDQPPLQPLRLLQAQVRGGARSPAGHGQHVGGEHVAEGNPVAVVRHREPDVRAVGRPARSVALVPGQTVRDLHLVVAGRDLGGGEGVGAVAVRVLQPGQHAVRRPIARTAQFALEVARRGDDRILQICCHPMGSVVVIERHRGWTGRHLDSDVAAVADPAGAVVLVPGVVDRRLVLVGSPAGSRKVAFQMSSSVSRVIWVDAQPGCQSPGHPSSSCRVPAMVTLAGCSTGPPVPRIGRHCRRVTDHTVSGGSTEIAGVILQDGVVFDEGALGQSGDVMEDPVGRIVVGAERRPFGGARPAARPRSPD